MIQPRGKSSNWACVTHNWMQTDERKEGKKAEITGQWKLKERT